MTMLQAIATDGKLCLLLPVDKGESWEEGQPVSGVQYKDAAGQLRTSKAHLTVCCDGMYSTFRKKLAKPSIHHPSFFVGLLLRDVQLPFPNHGHVVLAQPSPVLFYPISSKEVRRGVAIRGSGLRIALPQPVGAVRGWW